MGASGAIAITCPARGYLKKCISKCKSPEHPSHHLIREMKLFLEKLSCDGKTQPAKGSDQQDEDENCKDVPSNVRWMLIRQFISLSQHDLICPLENRSEETANETEKSASDSADATSLFNVSQRRLTLSVKENTDHTITPMPLFSGRISLPIVFELNRN